LEKPKTAIDWNKYKVGTIVKGTVNDVADYGVILTIDTKVKGFAHVKQVVVS
jgi:ribosomal protein S1